MPAETTDNKRKREEEDSEGQMEARYGNKQTQRDILQVLEKSVVLHLLKVHIYLLSTDMIPRPRSSDIP